MRIDLNQREREALLEMAKQDYRPPWEQIRYLIASEAQRRGIVQSPEMQISNGVGVHQDQPHAATG